MQPKQTPAAIALEVLAIIAGLLCMALGVYLQLHAPAAVAGYYQQVSGGGAGLIITGATILAAAAHSSKWVNAVFQNAGKAEAVVSQAEAYLPILLKFAPPQVGALVSAGVKDVDAILKALAAVEAAGAGTPPAVTAAQLAGGAAAATPAKVL